MLSSMSKVVIYARVSTKDQEREGYSIPAQLVLLREYAQKQQFEVTREFIESESAGHAGRTEFGKMVALLKADQNIKAILVEKTDRLYRNFRDQALLDDLGIDLHFVKDSRVIGKESKPSDRFVHDIEVAQGRFYLNNLSQEVRKGLDQKAREGKYPGGPIPIGYLRDRISGKIEIDADRAPLVRELFELYSGGEKSMDELHDYAKQNRLTYRKSGRAIARAEIERILKRVFYTGQFSWRGVICSGDHPALISSELFQRTQEVFSRRSHGSFSRKNFTFNRMISCGHCGSAVTAEIKKQRYVYYHCTGYTKSHKVVYLPEQEIDNQIAKIVGRVTLPYDWYSFLRASLEAELGNRKQITDRERGRLEIARDKIRADMKRTFQAKLDQSIPEEFFQSVFNDYQQRLSAIEQRLRNLTQAIEGDFDIALKAIELSYQAEDLYFRANSGQKRRLVKSLLSNCQLTDTTLYPTYNKPFDTLAEGIISNNKRG